MSSGAYPKRLTSLSHLLCRGIAADEDREYAGPSTAATSRQQQCGSAPKWSDGRYTNSVMEPTGPPGFRGLTISRQRSEVTCRGSSSIPRTASVWNFKTHSTLTSRIAFPLVDPGDVQKCGFQVSAMPNVLGVPNYNQATRIVALCLNKSIGGNTYVEFQTSVRALGILPGDIIAVTYARENFDRTPFRVVKVSPGQNFRRAQIRAQLHDDAWYSDTAANSLFNAAPQPSYQIGVPRPIAGVVTDSQGNLQFGIAESSTQAEDGTITLLATATFTSPPPVPMAAPAPPLVSLAASVSSIGGTLPSDSAFYYALTSVDGNGNESALSFAVLAVTNSGAATYSVKLQNLSLPAAATTFNVYRGPSPSELIRISSNNLPSLTFTDTGLPNLPYLPPDSNYDHANFYWRNEEQPSSPVTIYTSNTVGNATLQMVTNEFFGHDCSDSYRNRRTAGTCHCLQHGFHYYGLVALGHRTGYHQHLRGLPDGVSIRSIQQSERDRPGAICDSQLCWRHHSDLRPVGERLQCRKSIRVVHGDALADRGSGR